MGWPTGHGSAQPKRSSEPPSSLMVTFGRISAPPTTPFSMGGFTKQDLSSPMKKPTAFTQAMKILHGIHNWSCSLMGLAGSLRPRWPGQPVQWCRWTQSLVGFSGLQGFPCQETTLRLLLQLSMWLLNLQPSTAEERARGECKLIVPQSVQPASREGSIACTRWPVEDFGGAAHLDGNSTKSRPISL